MITFGTISQEKFLSEYWQKKPLLIKQALPGFINGALPDSSGVDENSLIQFCNRRALTAVESPTLSQRLFTLNLVQEV